VSRTLAVLGACFAWSSRRCCVARPETVLVADRVAVDRLGRGRLVADRLAVSRTAEVGSLQGRWQRAAPGGGPVKSAVAGCSEPRRVSSERVGAALAGEPGKGAATVLVEDLAELVAGVGQNAGRGDLVGLVEEEVALDRDVMSAEGIGGDRRGEVEQEQRPSGGSTCRSQGEGTRTVRRPDVMARGPCARR
jgi:hypothetical protein